MEIQHGDVFKFHYQLEGSTETQIIEGQVYWFEDGFYFATDENDDVFYFSEVDVIEKTGAYKFV